MYKCITIAQFSKVSLKKRKFIADSEKAQILRYTNLRSKYPRQLHVIDTIIAHLHKSPTLTHGHIEWKKTFKKHNDILDARRHTKLQDVNLELYEMINS